MDHSTEIHVDPSEELRAAVERSSRRGTGVMVLLGVCAVIAVFGLVSGLLQLKVLERVAGGAEISEGDAALSDMIYAGVGLLQMGAFLLTAIVWLTWLHGAYGNLRLVGTGEARFTPGWAVGYWFIPFINLFRPYQIMRDLSVRSAARNEEEGTSPATGSNLVGLWWLSYLTSAMVGRIFMRQSLGAEDLAGFVTSTKSGLVNDVATLLAAVLALALIRSIIASQRSWLARQPTRPGLGSGTAPGAA